MTTTTDYGTWVSKGDRSNTCVEGTIADVVSGADSEWRRTMEECGAFKAIARDYRDAINAALPDGVSLCGDDFYGPYYEDDREFDGHPVDEDGNLDIAAIIEGIDLEEIIDRYDVVDHVQQAQLAGYRAEEAAKAAKEAALARAEAVARVVEDCNGNQGKAAELLGIDRSRVSRLVSKAQAAAQ